LVIVTPALEAPAIVSSFDDIAVMCEAIEESGGHFGVCEDAWPFAEGEIGGDDYRGALVKPADEIEQQLTAGLGEGQISATPPFGPSKSNPIPVGWPCLANQ
jgi:hypothetical protein